MKKYPSISVVIPNWNGLWLLKQFLGAVVITLDNYPGKSDIIIFDNGSIDRSVSFIKDNFPTVTVISNPENIGFGEACNRAATHSNNDLVLFLNNDVYVPDDFVKKLVDEYKSCQKPFALTCNGFNMSQTATEKDSFFGSKIMLREADNGEIRQVWDLTPSVKVDETDYCSGAAMLVKRANFILLRGFDPIYGLAYYEDLDICLRAKNEGFKNYTAGSTHFLHRVSSTSNGVDNNFKKYLMLRNSLLFHFRFSSRPLRFLMTSATAVFRHYKLSDFLKQLPILLRVYFENNKKPVKKFYSNEFTEGDYFITPKMGSD